MEKYINMHVDSWRYAESSEHVFPEWLNATTTSRHCPKCGKDALDTRVHRQMVIKIFLFWMPLKRYKCSFCKKKSYIRP
jgi:hypothetical protein